MRKIALVILVVAATSALSFYLGRWQADSSAKMQRYDELILDLSTKVTVFDGMQGGDAIRHLLISSIYGDFRELVHLYEQGRWKTAETARCAISKKVRKLRQRWPMEDEDSEVVEYLASNCLGEPSHDNWATQ